MSDSVNLASATPPESTAASSRLGTAESRALLRECFIQYRARLLDMARLSLDMCGDLFEWNTQMPDADIERFRARRGEWLAHFGKTIDESYDRRIAGHRRKGRRPDASAQGLDVRMLTDVDHAKQAAVTDTAQTFLHATRQQAAALDQRFAVLVPDRTSPEIDNPFSPVYVLDAIGVTSRAVYPEPLIWRTLMDRLVTDLTPGVNKIYIALNRLLADHGVLPEISAVLRARSEYRPDQDIELLPVFKRLLAHAGDDDRARGSADLAYERGTLPAATVAASIKALAKTPHAGGKAKDAAAAREDEDAFPDLDPMLALGGTARAISMLTVLQRLDLPHAIAQEAVRSFGAADDARAPRNLIPHVSEALSDALENPADRTTADVVALLFDYIFRDHSLPERMRTLFARLQVPILKAALLEPAFFHDGRNPARKLLDDLAEASIGATSDESYCNALEFIVTDIIDSLSESFEIDLSVFAAARIRFAEFTEGERRKTAAAIVPEITNAAGAEKEESERGRVRAAVRDRLAGVDIPGAVRAFAETIWTDYLTLLLKQHGENAVVTNEALRTLDDLIWSVAAKERTGQKARLAKMIPGLVGSVRKGSQVLAVPDERAKAFLEALYQLHIAAIKVPAAGAATGPVLSPAAAAPGEAQASVADTAPHGRMLITAAHDFVSEMVPATWLEFRSEGRSVAARLMWTGRLRMKYVFASRSGLHVIVRAPEELAHALATGPVALVLEPVPLFDRAISAALNVVAARKPASTGLAPAAAPG